jgi:hypothetical protein
LKPRRTSGNPSSDVSRVFSFYSAIKSVIAQRSQIATYAEKSLPPQHFRVSHFLLSRPAATDLARLKRAFERGRIGDLSIGNPEIWNWHKASFAALQRHGRYRG